MRQSYQLKPTKITTYHELAFFEDTEFIRKRRKTRKELFLGRMDELIPWQHLEAASSTKKQNQIHELMHGDETFVRCVEFYAYWG